MMPDPTGSTALTDAERERMERVDRLAASGPASVPSLVKMLDDPSWAVRRSVVAALGAHGSDAVEPLCSVLRNNRDNEARLAAAVDALVASSGAPEPAVERLAASEEPPVVADAAQILGRRRSGRSVPLLSALIGHPDDNVAVNAIEALGRIGGGSAVDALVSAIFSGSYFRTFPAIDVLGRTGDPRAVGPLAMLLDNPRFAPEAARALGRTGDPKAIPPLAGLIGRRVESYVRLAAVALDELRERHRAAFGRTDPVDRTIRGELAAGDAPRRLVGVLAGANEGERQAIARLLGLVGGEDAVSVLTGLLDEPTSVALVAGEALVGLGRASDPRLLAALRQGDSHRRRILLPMISGPAAAREVIECLQDGDAIVRTLACEALARMGAEQALEPLFACLEDPNRRVVQAAIAAIQSLGSARTFELAAEAARSEEFEVRRAALRILSYFGDAEAVPLLLQALEDRDERLRDAALQGLGFIDAANATEALLEAARGESPRVRALAMRGLGQRVDDLRVTGRLVKALADPDAWVRYYSVQALGRLAFEPAAERIAQLLDDPAGQVAVAAVEALSYLPGATAFDALRRAAGSSDPDMQRAALVGLGLTRRPEAEVELLSAATAPDASTRMVAIAALADFPGAAVGRALSEAARDEDESVRHAAIGYLANRSDPDAVRTLVELLSAPVPRERVLAALSNPAMGKPAAMLEVLASSGDSEARAISEALVRMGGEESLSALIQAMSLENVRARRAAATSLAATGTRRAAAALARAAEQDQDDEVRRICTLLRGR